MPAPGERSAAVRQAVALPHVGGDPGAALVPGAGEALGVAEPVAPVEPEVAPLRIPEHSPQQQSAPTVPTQSAEPAVAVAAVEVEPPAAEAVGIGIEPPDLPDAEPHFEPAPGRPKKQMLAAAAIVGALLVTVPFVVLAVNSGDGKKHQTDTSLAAQDRTVLGKDGSKGSPPGTFTAESPAPPASKSASAPRPPSHSALPPGSPGSAPRHAAPSSAHVAPAAPALPKPAAKSTRKPTAKATPPAATAKPQAHTSTAGFGGLSDVLIKNTASGHCVDIPNYGNGTVNGPVREYTCDPGSGDNQMWNLDVTQKGAGPGSANLFLIRNVKDGYCMDLPYYGGNPATTKVTEYYCDGSFNDNQLWWLDKRPDGSYWIRNYSSNQLCLDVTGHRDAARDLDLTLFTCSDTDDQNWTFAS